jgi:hypothetical protein
VTFHRRYTFAEENNFIVLDGPFLCACPIPCDMQILLSGVSSSFQDVVV